MSLKLTPNQETKDLEKKNWCSTFISNPQYSVTLKDVDDEDEEVNYNKMDEGQKKFVVILISYHKTQFHIIQSFEGQNKFV